MRSWIYELGYEAGFVQGFAEGFQQGFVEGFEQAIHPLVRQLERRLARPLTKPEQSSLRKRLEIDDPDKVGDVVLDLSPQDLALWLAPTNGH